MKLNEVLYKTPEMTEEKLLEFIKKYQGFIKSTTLAKLKDDDIPKAILKEWDLIQEKKSYLTKSQRDQILALVSVCLARMSEGAKVDNNDKEES